ncbi:MAG: glyoxal reductase [Bacteroides sp. SM23_62]|nr:MAG: glyoxal reductase [Bacteroides sp. SM23_62]
MDIKTTVTLNNGVKIPILGLGVYQSPPGGITRQAILDSFEAGYRHVDTARIYGNEVDVGRAVAESGLPREEIFVTTKLWNADQGYESALDACEISLGKMDLEYIDLYLIHWPVEGRRLASWTAMEELLAKGKCRSIGISNFMKHHLEELLEKAHVVPAINQIEMSPYNYLQRKETLNLCESAGIVIEAYSPLTKGKKLKDPRLVEIAVKYGKTTAQLLIRWALEKQYVVLPKSVHKDRIIENADVFDFSISAEDMATMDTFNEDLATGWDPSHAI